MRHQWDMCALFIYVMALIPLSALAHVISTSKFTGFLSSIINLAQAFENSCDKHRQIKCCIAIKTLIKDTYISNYL